MKLSVVMAVRNGGAYLPEAIESVLAQSVTDFEFLIVDDQSDDTTAATLSRYRELDSRIRVFRNDHNVGPYRSANRALRHARGAFVTRHDADDVSPPDRFRIQLDAIESDPTVSLVTGAIEVFGPASDGGSAIARPPASQPRFEWELLFGNPVTGGAQPMFPRVLRGVPVRFPGKYFYAEDYGLWCRLSRLGRIVCPAEVVYRYRVHDSSLGSRQAIEQYECMTKMRDEYQALFLKRRSSAEGLSRFWGASFRRPLTGSVRSIIASLDELRHTFLDYVEQRYGASERTKLEAEVDAALSDRLGLWFYRSLRQLSVRRCRELLSVARDERRTGTVSRIAAGHVARAAVKQFSQHEGRSRRRS